jgi:hypothetical protein
MAKQQQVAEFFALDSRSPISPIDQLPNVIVTLPDGEKQPLFEVGLTPDELPEDLNFIPPPPKLTT